MTKPFKVDIERRGCSKCGQEIYSVRGPDEILREISYYNREDAQYHADELNDAFRMGVESVKAARK